MQKIKVYHFHNAKGGGVYSVIKNLLKFSGNVLIENHVIYTIKKDDVPVFEIKPLEGAVTEQYFYYSSKWNFYHTCKSLAKLITDEKAVIVAHDWLELGMASNLGLQNPVVYFLHGDFDYYYNLATRHEAIIDKFVTISPVIYRKLNLQLANRKTAIHYCRFPVPEVKPVNKENDTIRLFYCVRSLVEERKQFKILPLINNKLREKGVQVHWTIIGEGLLHTEIENLMGAGSPLSFYPVLSNEEVISLLPLQDIFILPSLKEGFPVSVVEAMKGGLVPLVTNWETATDELIIDAVTGFYIAPENSSGYADAIMLLNNNRQLLRQMADNAIKKANSLFDPYENTNNIEAVIIKAVDEKITPKHSKKTYGARLDEPWIPNIITTILR